jgi:hypothetical protein
LGSYNDWFWWDDAEEEVEAFLEFSVKGDLEEFDDEMVQMRQKLMKIILISNFSRKRN